MRRPRGSRAERLAEGRKGRALDDAEIGALWRSCGALGAFGGLIRLGLLTGLRRNELSGLRWRDVHDDRIVIDAARAKTGARHEVPVTSAMRAVLTAQTKTTSPLVFPSPRTGAAMGGWSKLTPKAIMSAGFAFRLHDLRRTARTLMSRLGVAEDIAELAIGHTRPGLVGVYNKDDGWSARVSAFECVSAHISDLVSGGATETGEDHEKRIVTLGARR
jgi:integrase